MVDIKILSDNYQKIYRVHTETGYVYLTYQEFKELEHKMKQILKE